MAVLVTGAAGLVGTSVCKKLAEQGHEVVALDTNRDPALLDLVLTKAQRERVRFQVGDLLDLPNLLRISRQFRVDRVVHLAYMITKLTRANLAYAQKVNVEGTNNVFELVLERGIEHLAWASTIDVFGPKSRSENGTVANDAAYDPQTAYGACKVLNEIAARDYALTAGLKAIALRIPAAFGPGVTNSWGGFIPQLIKDLMEGRRGQAPRLKKARPWLYTEDIADAFVRALDHCGEAEERGYTLPASEMETDRVIEMICGFFPGAAIEYVDWPDYGTVPSYDCEPLRRLLRWEPGYGVKDGLARIIAYYMGAANGSGPPR